MDFFGVVGVILRRWRVTIPVFVIGVGITARLVAGVGTEYESFGTVVFLPATVSIVDLTNDEVYEDHTNPYLDVGRTRTLAHTIPIAVGSADVREEAHEAGLAPNYEIDLDPIEPILFISARGSTPDQSSDTLDFVLISLAEELNERQGVTGDTPPNQRAVMEILSDVRAQEDTSASLKVMGTLGVALVLVTVMAAFAAEGLAERRLARVSQQT